MDDILLLSRDTLRDERDELERRGALVSYKTWEEVTAPLANFPTVVRWMMVVQDMPFQLSFMEELERGGTRVVNTPRAVQTCDKASMFFLWSRHLKDSIDMPPTIMTGSVARAREFIAAHGRAVLKPVDGQGGSEIAILDAKDTRALSKLNDHPGTLFLQAMIPSTHEIRTVVAGDEIIAQYARYNLRGLHSLGTGAILLPVDDSRVELPSDIARDLGELALTTRKMTGLDMLALDTLIDAKQQPWLLEWNPFFAYGMTKELGFTIASRIADFIMSIRSR
jgi:glutathione synthase/RimK-type ligase-like ATP-grasp enzyme